jgi:hypothetical protein
VTESHWGSRGREFKSPHPDAEVQVGQCANSGAVGIPVDHDGIGQEGGQPSVVGSDGRNGHPAEPGHLAVRSPVSGPTAQKGPERPFARLHPPALMILDHRNPTV